MFASVKLSSNPQSSLIVPEQAVIRTGTRNIVIVAHEQGRFEPVVVQLGQSDGNKIAILEGLKVGQKVVISGQFLIDSEANLQGVLDKLNTGKSTPSQAVKTSKYQGIGKVEKVTAQEVTISHHAHDGDGFFSLNFRADRAREILAAIGQPDFNGFDTGVRPKWAVLLGMVDYSAIHDTFMSAA